LSFFTLKVIVNFEESDNMSNITNSFSSIKHFFFLVGDISRFGVLFFKEGFNLPIEWKEIMRQSIEIGYRSLPLVGITAFIMGLVLTVQSRPTLVEFGAESWLPAMVSVSIIREIGPVITALICAGKVGSRIGAELGSMKVTEQIDAMEVSGTNPFKYLVTTRIISTTLMLPLLVILADIIALYGAYLGVNLKGSVSPQLYFNQIIDALEFSDLIPSIVKSFFFGFAIGLIGCYMGFHSKKGTEDVGDSANSAVVVASLMIFVIDLLAVQVIDLFYGL
jgi:phospholipid/cholesterol/gamma-HCH transport system permease protein